MEEGRGVAVGETVSDVAAPLVSPEGGVEETSLGALADDGPVLVCFYTLDFSPDCVEEWCAFRDFDWFSAGDVRVVGASKSGITFHRWFIDRLDLGFSLYADEDLALAEAFDVDYRAFGVFRRSRRSCFLLGGDLTVRYRWLGEHWLDPTLSVPPVEEVYAGVTDALDRPEPETFGF